MILVLAIVLLLALINPAAFLLLSATALLAIAVLKLGFMLLQQPAESGRKRQT